MSALALFLAIVLLAAAIWIVVPAQNYWLLALSIGAPELSAWLLVASGLVVLMSLPGLRRRWSARLALLGAIGSGLLAWQVLGEIGPAVTAANRSMTESFGAAVLDTPSNSATMTRTEPVVQSQMLVGLPSTDVRESHGVPIGTTGDVPLALDIYQPGSRSDTPSGGAAKRPIVVQIYAGGWRDGMPGDHAAFARQYAARGYVVFAVDYRHAPQWKWPAQLADIRMALAWIKTHAGDYNADASRIALIGRSAGAQLALIAGMSPADPAIRAIVALYSPVNLTDGWEHVPQPDTLGVRSMLEALIGGTPANKPDLYRDASPISYADRPHPPVLLINGGHDRVVALGYATTLHEHLRKSGTAGLIVLPWADHAFDLVSFGPSAQMSLYYTERFLAQQMWKPIASSRR